MRDLPQSAEGPGTQGRPGSVRRGRAASRVDGGLQLFGGVDEAEGGTWTFDTLNTWLTKPSAYVPGTAMTFAGLQRENQRADIIAYLNTLSDHPLPLPTANKEGGQASAAGPAPPRTRAAGAGDSSGSPGAGTEGE